MHSDQKNKLCEDCKRCGNLLGNLPLDPSLSDDKFFMEGLRSIAFGFNQIKSSGNQPLDSPRESNCLKYLIELEVLLNTLGEQPSPLFKPYKKFCNDFKKAYEHHYSFTLNQLYIFYYDATRNVANLKSIDKAFDEVLLQSKPESMLMDAFEHLKEIDAKWLELLSESPPKEYQNHIPKDLLFQDCQENKNPNNNKDNGNNKFKR